MNRLILLFAAVMLSGSTAASAVGLPAGTQIRLVAGADYTDAFAQSRSAPQASALLTVARVAGVDVDPQETAKMVTAGQSVYVPIKVMNSGNSVDTFQLSGQSASGWVVSFVYDDNDDGVHQSSEQWTINNTGMVAADGYCPCFAKIAVPAAASSGDNVVLTAASSYDRSRGIDAEVVSLNLEQSLTSSVSISASKTSATVGEIITLSGQLSPAAQAQLSINITDPQGSVSTSSVTTAGDGKYSTTFTPALTGSYLIQVNYTGTAQISPSSNTTIVQIKDKVATTLTMSCITSNPYTGKTLEFSGNVNPALAVPLTVNLTGPSGSIETAQVTSNAQGEFTWSKKITTAGNWSIEVTYAGDDFTSDSSTSVSINVAQHSLSLIGGPTLNPSEVISAASTQCSINVTDSISGHGLTYQWSDGGAGGTFSPNSSAANPTYTAKSNVGGSDVSVTISCTVRCSQDSTLSKSGQAVLVVHPLAVNAPQVSSLTPANAATFVAWDNSIVIKFSKAMNKTSAQSAVLTTPGLSSPAYSWSTDGTTLTITHAPMYPATTYICSVAASAKDTNGVGLANVVNWTFTTKSAIFETSELTCQLGKAFTTPRILCGNRALGESVTLVIGIPDGYTVDGSVSGGGIASVTAGSDVTSFTSSYDAADGEITVSATVIANAVNPEIVKSIRLTSPSAAGNAQLTINGGTALTLTNRMPTPGDFDSNGRVSIGDATQFIQSWVRWHQHVPATYDPAQDAKYDIAPKTTESWPNWSPIGNMKIDIGDAMAFIDCWSSSRSVQQQAVFGAYIPDVEMTRRQCKVSVMIDDAENGIFDVTYKIPDDCSFSPALCDSGNLSDVTGGKSVTGLFFSEYIPEDNAIRLAGIVEGKAPYEAAAITLYK